MRKNSAREAPRFRDRLRFWRVIGIILVSVSIMIILLSWLAGVTVIQSILAVGSVSTAVGIFIALWTLHEAHEWNRRHYTIELLDKWNENARKHLEALEIEFPDLFAVPDFIARPEVKTTWFINRDRAKRLVKVSSESEEFTKNDMLIRGHLLAVLY